MIAADRPLRASGVAALALAAWFGVRAPGIEPRLVEALQQVAPAGVTGPAVLAAAVAAPAPARPAGLLAAKRAPTMIAAVPA